jgi:chorismate-pyruvate lyase
MGETMADHLASTASEPEAVATASSGGSTKLTSGLTKRHFARQEQRPDRLGDVALSALAPSLRTLLFTDGTVTRTLEAQTLSRVTVSVVGQTRHPVDDGVAGHLEAPPSMEAVRRRVTIGFGGSATPVIWAESHILAERLPDGFLGLLSDTPDGIGESLQQMQLEGWREMLWFGLDAPPPWDVLAADATPAFLTRLYRVFTGGRPALLISESFAVEENSGAYRLLTPGS